MLKYITLTDEKDLFFSCFFLFALTFYSQIRPSGFGFTSPSPSSSDPDGSSSENAASSAYAIKQAYPSSTNGVYWISNAS